LIDSYIEVGGNNNNKNQKTTGNDDDEQVAGIHTTDPSEESINNDASIPDEQPDNTMNAALAAVQDGGEEDPNYYSQLEIDDIDFDSEQVAGIHLLDKEDGDSVEDSSSNSSSYHLSDHYYCPSDDNEYPSSSDDDESSLERGMPGLQIRDD
jgi:hypothetical protein